MTLTEFLLARIAEQKRHAEKDPNAEWGYGAGWLLADAEAKRALVEQAACETCHTDPVMDWVLRVMSWPYVEHPDYDESWRP